MYGHINPPKAFRASILRNFFNHLNSCGGPVNLIVPDQMGFNRYQVPLFQALLVQIWLLRGIIKEGVIVLCIAAKQFVLFNGLLKGLFFVVGGLCDKT